MNFAVCISRVPNKNLLHLPVEEIRKKSSVCWLQCLPKMDQMGLVHEGRKKWYTHRNAGVKLTGLSDRETTVPREVNMFIIWS